MVAGRARRPVDGAGSSRDVGLRSRTPREFWPTKFAILASRATFVVPVMEDSHGSHHWEAGNLDQPKYRPKVHVLKRDYATEAGEHAHFSAMVSPFVDIMDRDGRVYRRTTEMVLRERVHELPA